MLHCPAGEPVEPVVVVLRVDPARVEVQVPAVRLRVETAAPVVAVRASVVPALAVAVAAAGEEYPDCAVASVLTYTSVQQNL